MINEQCAFKEKGTCRVLLECNCFDCAFFKTESELAYDRERAAARIAQLPLREQIHIKRKYYGVETTEEEK